MRRYCLLLILPLAISMLAFLPQKGGKSKQEPYADLNAATPRELPKELAEISAMVYDATVNAIFAVTDEEGVLYQLPLNSGGVLKSRRFYGRGDFEGLARVGSNFYALISDGDLVEFPAGSGDVDGRKYKADFPGKTEFESLYYDEIARRLVLLCKECSNDKRTTVSAFFFDPVTKRYSSSPVSFSTKDVKALSKGKGDPLRASDAAIHPITGELYILASLNHLLIIADARTGAFKRSFDLDKKLFKQPEGLCFSPRGDLYISNERGGKGSATLLMYPYKPRP